MPRLEAAAGCGSGCGSGEAMPSSRVGSLPRLEQLRLQESSFGAHSPSTPASGLFDSPESRASGVWTPDAASPSEGDEQADDEADDDEGEAGGEQTGEEESKAPPTVQQSVRRLMKGVDDMAEAASWLQVAIVEGQVEVVEAIAASAPEALDKVGNVSHSLLHSHIDSRTRLTSLPPRSCARPPCTTPCTAEMPAPRSCECCWSTGRTWWTSAMP